MQPDPDMIDSAVDAIFAGYRETVAKHPAVIGTADGPHPKTFFVLSYGENEEGQQAVTLSLWDASGLMPADEGGMEAAFYPKDMLPIADMLTAARARLEEMGKVAKAEAVN
jgi:hypothetical protein